MLKYLIVSFLYIYKQQLSVINIVNNQVIITHIINLQVIVIILRTSLFNGIFFKINYV